MVARSMHDVWLSNAYVLGDEPGGTAVFVDAGLRSSRCSIRRAREPDASPTSCGRTGTPITSIHEDELCKRFRIGVVTGDRRHGRSRVRAMALPGHSDDGVAFVVNDELCFTGDVLFRDAVGGGDPARRARAP